MAMITSGEVVTQRRYQKDRYGDLSLIGEWEIGPCAFAWGTTRENDDRSQQVQADAQLFGAFADIQPEDVIERPDGSTWDVVGLAEHWVAPWNAWSPGTVVNLRRVTG